MAFSAPQTGIYLFQSLLKSEHSVRKLLIRLLYYIGIVGIGMMVVEKLNNVKPASIDVKVNIAFLKVWCNGFPYCHFRVQLFHSTPRGVADAFAMRFWGDKQEIEIAHLTLYFDYDTANRLPILHDSIGFTTVN